MADLRSERGEPFGGQAGQHRRLVDSFHHRVELGCANRHKYVLAHLLLCQGKCI